MFSTSVLSLLIIALASVQVASEGICYGKSFCFNSFDDACDNDKFEDSGTCTFNSENSYKGGDMSSRRLIFDDEIYEVSWTGDTLAKYPIRLAWHVFESDRTRSEPIDRSDPPGMLVWDTNVTEGSSMNINFDDLIKNEFPNNHTNLTGSDVWAYAIENPTYLAISQPKNPPSENLTDSTERFFVAPASLRSFLENENEGGHKDEKKKWNVGVGVGVGVGVPALLAVIVFLIWWRSRKSDKAFTTKGTHA